MIIDCIADLHGFYPKLEGGDLLIVAGDLTARNRYEEYEQFFEYLRTAVYKKIIVIGGNHDNKLTEEDEHDSGFPPIIADLMHFNKMMYLCDSGTEFEGLKIYGTPWTRTFEGMNPKCKAFTCDTEEELAEKWALIPDDIDILITHGPPIAVLDRTVDARYVGSISLSAQLGFLQNLKAHIFGHIHESYGKINPGAYPPNYFDVCKHYSVNCSHVNEYYQPVNKSIRVIL